MTKGIAEAQTSSNNRSLDFEEYQTNDSIEAEKLISSRVEAQADYQTGNLGTLFVTVISSDNIMLS